MAALRERAAQHDEEIGSVHWFTVAELAARWRVSETTVREIPSTELRYKEFGQGKALKRRRYKPEWVEAFENAKPNNPEIAA